MKAITWLYTKQPIELSRRSFLPQVEPYKTLVSSCQADQVREAAISAAVLICHQQPVELPKLPINTYSKLPTVQYDTQGVQKLT